MWEGDRGASRAPTERLHGSQRGRGLLRVRKAFAGQPGAKGETSHLMKPTPRPGGKAACVRAERTQRLTCAALRHSVPTTPAAAPAHRHAATASRAAAAAAVPGAAATAPTPAASALHAAAAPAPPSSPRPVPLCRHSRALLISCCRAAGAPAAWAASPRPAAHADAAASPRAGRSRPTPTACRTCALPTARGKHTRCRRHAAAAASPEPRHCSAWEGAHAPVPSRAWRRGPAAHGPPWPAPTARAPGA